MKLKITGQSWTLVPVPAEERLIDENARLCYGDWDYHSQKMHVDIGREPVMVVQSMFHELLHVLNHNYGLALTHEQIEGISNAETQVLAENREYRRKIFSLLEDGK